jgi:hypothetical protein
MLASSAIAIIANAAYWTSHFSCGRRSGAAIESGIKTNASMSGMTQLGPSVNLPGNTR